MISICDAASVLWHLVFRRKNHKSQIGFFSLQLLKCATCVRWKANIMFSKIMIGSIPWWCVNRLGNANYALFIQFCIFIDYGIPHEVSSQMTFYRIWWSFYTVPLVPFVPLVPLVPFVPLVPLVPLTLLVPLLWNLSSILCKQLNIIINISYMDRIDHGFSHPWSEGFRQKNIKVGDLRWKILWKNNCWYVFSLLRKD